MDLVSEIYSFTEQFPKGEKYGIKSQLRRAAVSVPSNIAEGCGRNSLKQTSNFVNYSISSLYELETQVIISTNLKLTSETRAQKIFEEITSLQKMTSSFQRKIQNKTNIDSEA